MNLTFYYASQPSELFHLKDQCTIWLPEHQPPIPTMWDSNQVIATCDLSYLFQAKEHIITGNLKHNEIIWIEIKNQTATGHLFNPTGKIENFFRIV